MSNDTAVELEPQFVFDRRVHALWDEKIVPSVNKELALKSLFCPL
jgi:hypothetical protein